MALCPRCKKSFREPEDERGQHDCPKCGYSLEEAMEEREEE